MAVTKNKINHARLCMMGGCRNKNTDLYSKRSDVFNNGLYLCPDCAKEIGLLVGLVEKTEEETPETPDGQSEEETPETPDGQSTEGGTPAVQTAQTAKKARSKA